MAQKLFTKAIENALKKYGYASQDGKGKDAKVIARFFGGCYTCYILESTDDEDILFGLADLGYGFEYGTISRSELESVRVPPFNTPLERDKLIEPLKKTLGECMEMYSENFYK